MTLSTVGELIELCIEVTFDNTPSQVNLTASICHNNRSANDPNYYIGLAFRNLTQQDKLMLNFATQAQANE
jgi:hypothetical protein